VRERVRNWREFSDRSPEAREILVHVAGEAVGDLAREVGVLVGQVAKAEVRVVKGVHQLPHILDSLAQRGGVAVELLRAEVIGIDRFVHRVGGQHPALEREHEAG